MDGAWPPKLRTSRAHETPALQPGEQSNRVRQPQLEDGNQRSPSTREPAEPSAGASIGTTISSGERPIVVAAGKRASLLGADFKKAVLRAPVFTPAPRKSRDASAMDLYYAFAHTVRDRLAQRWVATQRTYGARRQARLLPVRRVPASGERWAQPDEPGPLRRRARGARRARASTSTRPRAGARRGPRQRRPRAARRLLPRLDGHARLPGDRLRHPLRVRHLRAGDQQRLRRSSAPTSGCSSATRGRSRGRSTP